MSQQQHNTEHERIFNAQCYINIKVLATITRYYESKGLLNTNKISDLLRDILMSVYTVAVEDGAIPFSHGEEAVSYMIARGFSMKQVVTPTKSKQGALVNLLRTKQSKHTDEDIEAALSMLSSQDKAIDDRIAQLQKELSNQEDGPPRE